MKFTLPTDYTKLEIFEKRLVREQYIEEQEGKCYWCKEDLTKSPPFEITSLWLNLDLFPKGFLNHPIHLQHSHKTGMTEGAVHAYCNGIMWQYHNR